MPSCVSGSNIFVYQRRCFGIFVCNKCSLVCCLDEVVSHDESTDQIQSTTNRSKSVERYYLHGCLKKVFVHQETLGIKFLPHQTLYYPRYVHRQSVEYNS